MDRSESLHLENETLRHKLSLAEQQVACLESSLASIRDVVPVSPEQQAEEDKDKALSIIVLGASGDLAKKKTFPSIFGLFREKLLPQQARVYGYARRNMSNEEFREQVTEYIKIKPGEEETLKAFKDICFYFATESYSSTKELSALSEQMKSGTEKEASNGANRLFYLALPPVAFVDACSAIRKVGCTTTGWNRIIVEKPFGHDEASSEKLSKELGVLFREDQLFRIDHYLGKEMVQNLMVLRFANSIWEPMWNRQYIKNVKITFKEDFGVSGRAGYFDQYGIIRDVMQNHLMQLLTLIGMEQPLSLAAEDVRDAKVRVLRSIPPLMLNDLVVGQYGPSPDGKHRGYHDDPEVPKDSITPTFAQAILWINNPRWHGVPFILKCAKAVDERKAEIRIQFRDNPGHLFPNAQRNELVIKVQPAEAVYVKVMNKTPGLSSNLVISDLDLTYNEKFADRYTPDAYERLILEAIRGDHNLFVRSDELSAAWRIFTPALHKLEEEKIMPLKYPFGSYGPVEAVEQIEALGWKRLAVEAQSKV
eukprot:TRINITY_DN16923_c0_g1_i1.p1 TRINITY_DN16923_c0_g1~~TRINITY_DN16923_c0_g1_i1.p1  ORF type:complete len:536 (+),score=161.78 TRINITY_DN16923_c0_g1_i1:159-1766(+)